METSIFIYQLEAHPRYLALTDPLFAWMERPNSRAVTSTITMTELLVQPYRNGNEELVNQFYGLLSTYPNLEWVAPTIAIADEAARLRALYKLRTPDALQAATATHALATGMVTNDSVFERVKGFETLFLDAIL